MFSRTFTNTQEHLEILMNLASYISHHLPKMMVEGGRCVCGRSQYLMQRVTFVTVKLQQVVAGVVCIKFAMAQRCLIRDVWCHRWRCVGLVSVERRVIGLESIGYTFGRHALVPAIQTWLFTTAPKLQQGNHHT